MAKTESKSGSDYIGSQPKSVQGTLKRVRSTVRKAIPGAEEVISYGMPTYKLHGSTVLRFAGWKQHYSLYPATSQVVAACKDDLAQYEVNKSTIRFPVSRPVPARLIARIATLRAKEVAQRQAAKAPATKKL